MGGTGICFWLGSVSRSFLMIASRTASTCIATPQPQRCAAGCPPRTERRTTTATRACCRCRAQLCTAHQCELAQTTSCGRGGNNLGMESTKGTDLLRRRCVS
jgi:hypothetical protein